MSLFQRPAILSAVTCLAVMAPAIGQQAQRPRIGYVYPAGGKQGTSFQVTVGGQFLGGVTNAHFSGDGVQATVTDHARPLSGKESLLLLDKLKELMDRKAQADNQPKGAKPRTTSQPAWTAEDDKAIAEIKKKLAYGRTKQGNQAIAETVTLQVTVTPDAAAGPRELRLATPMALTNPIVFCVGQLPEYVEESKERSEPPKRKPPKFEKQGKNRPEPRRSAPAKEMSVKLPAIVNGQIMPGEVDRYRFRTHTGQQLVIAASAQALIPYLPDAVPGWFQATLTLYDDKGKEVAYNDDYRFHPDPVIFYQVRRGCEYVIEIKDAIYRGREDFVYRIAMGELPFVTGIFPLGGKAGDETAVELQGWNLPQTHLTQDLKGKNAGIIQISANKASMVSNQVPFKIDTLTEYLEKEPNNAPADAQLIKLPVIVNGRIDKPGDCDVFRFEGHGGDVVVAETCARRLDSPLDSVLKLTDAAGRQLAFNDDHEDKGAGLTTHHADSYLKATLPANGTYYVHVGDSQDKGGSDYAYRLRVSPPIPDFELRAVPSSVHVRAGASAALTVYALRKDGFSGEIELALKDAPAGFQLNGARIPGNKDQVQLPLRATASSSADDPISLSIEGHATIQGRRVIHPTVPAEDMMQAFAYRHLVPARELLVSVSGRGAPKNAMRILSAMPVKISAGGTTRIRAGLPTATLRGKIHLELNDAPDGITIRNVSSIPEGTEITLQADARRVTPGIKGNLIVNVFVERVPESAAAKPQAKKRRLPVGTLPAIPYEIVAK